jgi:two-component system sensor histidine kinase DegS
MSLERLSRLGDKNKKKPEVAEAVPPTPVQILEQTSEEYERVQKELKEVDILIKQSTTEVEKLAQRNAQLTNKLRTMEANIDTVPRQDIKEIYNAAQEAQMRLFMMRGQVEQLQSKQETMKQFAESLRKILDVSDNLLASLGDGAGAAKPGSQTANGEVSGIVKIINAQETERQRLANQLHDGPAQSLTNLILQAEICERLLDSDPIRARTELTELKHAVTGTFQKVREFIFDLRPMMLDDLGLIPTLKKSIEDYEQKSGIACNLTISGKDLRMPPHTEVTIFRVTQELLKNVRSHAQATHIQIALDITDERAKVSIEDDGIGFNVKEVMSASQQRKTIGLSTMREQVDMLGGEIDFNSDPGRGTRVEFWVPAS